MTVLWSYADDEGDVAELVQLNERLAGNVAMLKSLAGCALTRQAATDLRDALDHVLGEHAGADPGKDPHAELYDFHTRLTAVRGRIDGHTGFARADVVCDVLNLVDSLAGHLARHHLLQHPGGAR